MLRIGDIHINKKNTDTLIDALSNYITAHDNEQHIVFFGDYVYHFQYERSALLALYGFFLDLYSRGKHLYILAGNHDWIHNYFVYEEGKRSFAHAGDHQQGAIHFITTPSFFHIEGQDCLFFPYSPFLTVDDANDTFLDLRTSSHTGEQLSGIANASLHDHIMCWRAKKQRTATLHIYHHRYIADTQFPGQQARFSYKNHALAPDFARQEDLLLVSGHLHQPFARERYICIGSIWYTSPLEVNQSKYLFQVDISSSHITAQQIVLDPYLRIAYEASERITEQTLEDLVADIGASSCQYLSTSHMSWDISFVATEYDWARVTLTIVGSDVHYHAIDTYIDSDIQKKLQRITLKRPTKSVQVVAQDLDIMSDKLGTSIAHRKDLLQQYIQKKWPDESDDYLTLLHTMDIL